MTHEAKILGDVLRRVALRIGVRTALYWVARAAAVLGLAVLGWALVTMVIPVPLPLREVAIAGLGGLFIAGVVLARALRPSLLGAARVTDRRLHLADRLSTAVDYLGRREVPRGVTRMQIVDATVAAQGVAPRAAAPITVPREVWAALAIAGALALWAQFLQGWAIPGLPAARTVLVIRGEGRTLAAIGRQLDATSRARGLPESRRAAPGLLDLGRQLQSPRVTRQDALQALQEAGRKLQSAQSSLERRLAGTGLRGAPGSQEARMRLSSPGESTRLHRAVQELESLAGRLRNDRDDARDDVAKRLGALSESLDRMNAPISTRRAVESARRDAEQGHAGSAAAALGDALQDLNALERMLGDDQALGEAKRQVEKSSERIAQGGPLGAGPQAPSQPPQGSTSQAQAPGASPPDSTSADAPPPAPGPNQGSLPGEGRGGRSGAPTARLGARHVEQHLTGRQGEGSAITRDLVAPGRVGTPRLGTLTVPADVAHQNDRALSRDPLPPAYLTFIRRYFETEERAP